MSKTNHKVHKVGLIITILISTSFCLSISQEVIGQKTNQVRSNQHNSDITERFMRDVYIGAVDGVQLNANIALPNSERNRKSAAIVLIHGGGFISGSKDKFDRLLSYYAKNLNMIAMAPSYRLAPEYGFPAAIEDIKTSIRFLKANAEKLDLNPDNIIVAGVSSGGYLAIMTAVTGNNDSFSQYGLYTEYDSKIRAAMSQSGPIGDFHNGKYPQVPLLERMFENRSISLEEAQQAVSPSTYLDENDPPMFIVHGDSDPVVPVEMSQDFVNHLKENNLIFEYHEIPSGTHSLSDSVPELASEVREKQLNFIIKYSQ